MVKKRAGSDYAEIPTTDTPYAAQSVGPKDEGPMSTYIVQEDGVIIGDTVYNHGDEVEMTEKECDQYRTAGVALVEKEDTTPKEEHSTDYGEWPVEEPEAP